MTDALEPVLIDRASSVPVYAQIAGSIRSQITGGRLAQGSRLPPIRSLTREFGSSVATVQRAIRDLQAEGLLVGRQGSGVYVSRAASLSGRQPGELWVGGDLPAPDEKSWVRTLNELQRRIPGSRVLRQKEGADVVVCSLDFLPRLADKAADMRGMIEEVYGRSADDPGTFGPLRVNGRHLMLPLWVNPGVVVCNAPMFEDAGIALPGDDWTWEDCLALSRAFTRPEQGQYGFYPSGLGYIYLSGLWQEGGRLFSEDGLACRICEEPSVRFAGFLRRLSAWSMPSFPPGDWPVAPAADAMAQGKVAMMVGSVWFPDSVAQRKDLRWTAAPLPRGAIRASALHAQGCVLRKDTPVPETARTFLKCAVEAECSAESTARGPGYHLRAGMQRDDAIERAYRLAVEHGRSFLSDIQPERRAPSHLAARRIINASLFKIFNTSEPVERILQYTAESVNAVLHDGRDDRPG